MYPFFIQGVSKVIIFRKIIKIVGKGLNEYLFSHNVCNFVVSTLFGNSRLALI